MIEVHKRIILDDVKKDERVEKESKTEEGANKENAGPSNIDDDAAVAATLAADADGPCEKCREHPLRNGRRCKPSIKEYTNYGL